jgi:hypothetical protein
MSREVMYALVGREHLVPAASTQPRPVFAPTPQPSTVQMSFSQAVEIFRQNYVLYKTTGQAQYKTAYETADAWIQQYLSNMQTRVVNSKQEIASFVDRNINSGTELGQLSEKMKKIKKEGPESQDKYLTIKRINSQEEDTTDYTDIYVKAGIAAALIGVAVVVNAF